MKSLLSCAFLLLVFEGAAGDSNPKKRTECDKSSGLHHVLVTFPGDDIGVCGGSLISQEWVLTAGICNKTDMEVILGHHPDLKGDRRKVTEIIQYTEGNVVHNIMLMKVENKSAHTFPNIKLPDVNNCLAPKQDDVVEFFAWINAEYNFKKDTDVLQKLQTGQLKVSKCTSVPILEKQPLPYYLDHEKHHLLCAKHPDDVEDCELFPGSSLLQKGILHGVLVNYDFLCKKQVEFMDVCKYRKWIKDKAKV